MGLDLLGRTDKVAEKMRGMDPGMETPMARFTPLFGMLAIMMAAMMPPNMVPTLRSYEDLMISADGTRVGWLGVVLCYMVIWLAFAATIASVQLLLRYQGIIDMLGIAKSRLVSVTLLVTVGAFQFTRIKNLCHGNCHSPSLYFLAKWNPGFAGGVRMGLGLGAFCVGFSWGFMALGFVGGVMSLFWMGAATLFMVLEELPQIGQRVTKSMGILLIFGGIVLAIT